MVKKTQKIIPERLLLDTLERLSRMLVGFSAIHLHLSRLRPQNRKDVQLRIVVRMFDQILAKSRGRIFTLSNSDIVILGKDIDYNNMEETIERVRNLFQNDPLVYSDPDDAEGKFSSWHELESEYSLFYANIENTLIKIKDKQKQEANRGGAKPIEPEDLDEVLKAMSTIGVSDLIRRQCVISINPHMPAEILFQEFYTSMADLKQAVAPDINLLSDRWLFQHLSRTLDRRLLPVLRNAKLYVTPPAVSLNMNISTVFTPEFQRFMKKIGNSGQRVIVEVQMMDVFQNVLDYKAARDQLRENGHKILLDGLSSLSLQFIDIHLFDADFIKLIWSPTLADEDQDPDPRQLIRDFGPKRVVIARCDTEDAIKWGLSAGVSAFQGYFIDAMAGAMTKGTCEHGKNCTLGQCIARRATIAGNTRTQCTNPKMLDGLPQIKSI